MICSVTVTGYTGYRFCGKQLFPSDHTTNACYVCPEHGCRVVGFGHVCKEKRMAKPGWHEYYLDICVQVARRSSCVKRQNGCVVVKDNRIVSTGYNGTPRGVPNCNEGGCARCNDPSIPSGTRLDECLCSHSEENAVVQAAYHGVSLKGATIYTQISPCIWCAKMIINSGITKVVYLSQYPQNGLSLLKAGKVETEHYVKEGTTAGIQ